MSLSRERVLSKIGCEVVGIHRRKWGEDGRTLELEV